MRGRGLSPEIKQRLMDVCMNEGWDAAALACAEQSINISTLRKHMWANGHRTGRRGIVLYEGKQMRLTVALRAAGSIVSYETARKRLRLGWSLESAMTLPQYGEKQTPEHIEMMAERRRARDRARGALYRAAKREKRKIALVANAVPKTTVAYRKLLPRMPEMSKNELRAMLAEAVRNTAGAV